MCVTDPRLSISANVSPSEAHVILFYQLGVGDFSN